MSPETAVRDKDKGTGRVVVGMAADGARRGDHWRATCAGG